MKKVIALFNKFLAKFKLQVTPVQEKQEQKELTLAEACVKFLDENPVYCFKDYSSYYVGNIDYVTDKSGNVYFKDTKGDSPTWFCEYNYKKPSPKVLSMMISETTFSQKELEEKLSSEELIRKAKKSNGKTTDTGRNDGDCR